MGFTRAVAVGDWAAQFDLCHEGIKSALGEAGAVMDDIVRKRTFTLDGAEQNRSHGEGPAWCNDSRPASLGRRVDGLAHPDMLVEVEAMAIKGAHADIEWARPRRLERASHHRYGFAAQAGNGVSGDRGQQNCTPEQGLETDGLRDE